MKHPASFSIPSYARYALCLLLAFLTVVAFGLNLSPQLPNSLREAYRGGEPLAGIYNLILTLHASYRLENLTALLLGLGCFWLYRRFFLTGRGGLTLGEIGLSCFFALTMLLSQLFAIEETVYSIASSPTQFLKCALYFGGMATLFLAGVRGLEEMLSQARRLPPLKEGTLWARHPFLCPMATLLAAWLPWLIMKYPGGMSPDVTTQICDFLDGWVNASHPLFTSVFYGLCYQAGASLGHPNEGIFLMTLFQTVLMLLVLSYAMCQMRQWKLPRALYLCVLLLFCFAPNYSGWVTCLVKDVPYVSACLLLAVLLHQQSLSGEFLLKKRNLILLFLAWITLWLWRKNGMVMVAVSGLYLLISAAHSNPKKAALVRLACVLLASAAVPLTLNGWISSVYSVTPSAQREAYSLPIQMTAQVVVLHGDELSQAEKDTIDPILTYDRIEECFNPVITDGVKQIFHENATAEQFADYRALVLRQFFRYPLDYCNAHLNLIYRLFDLNSDRIENASIYLTREISHPYYNRSYTNELYRQESLTGLNLAQETAETLNYIFQYLPLAGLCVNIGFCTDFMLALLYLGRKRHSKKSLAVFLPGLVTLVFCLFSPLVYIRYALPITASLPICFSAWVTQSGARETSKRETPTSALPEVRIPAAHL